MKPIIFVRIADMKYYKGISDNDKPVNGGSYVNETGYANEEYNFEAVDHEQDDSYCLGFVMMARTSKNGYCQLHIERINGCQIMDDEELVEGVTVVWCSKAHNSKNMRVVGFYKNATIFRYSQTQEFETGYVQDYNFLAKKEDCVLLPYSERHSNRNWYIPCNQKGKASFGFGRSNIWYANNCKENQEQLKFVERMINSIENYNGENWIDKVGDN